MNAATSAEGALHPGDERMLKSIQELRMETLCEMVEPPKWDGNTLRSDPLVTLKCCDEVAEHIGTQLSTIIPGGVNFVAPPDENCRNCGAPPRDQDPICQHCGTLRR